MRKPSNGLNRVFMALVFLFLYAPIVVLIVFSFNAGTSNAVWKGFSFEWYEQLFHNRMIMESVYTTLLVSLLATVIATVVGTFTAIGFYAMRRRTRAPLEAVNNIPMMNADIVTGVSMCLLFVAFFGFWNDFAEWANNAQDFMTLPSLSMGFGTLLIAHISFNIPYVLLSVSPKLRQMDKNLIDAAQDLGCTWIQAFWKVALPEIKPGIVSGALIAFTMSIDDFVISYFTAGSSTSTLAMAIYSMTKKRVSPVINAVSTLLFITVLVLLVVVNIRDAKQAQAPTKQAADAGEQNSPLKKIALGALACLVIVALIFTGQHGNSNRVVNVCSWGEYIDESLIEEFESQTGITVHYQTTDSNETLYSLLKSGAGDYDVIVPSDYMIARLISEDMLAELDYSAIPNFAHIDSAYQHLSYDPENRYTVPYTWGTLGIIYNESMVDEPITSWSAMFDEKYAGQVLMIRNSRDALGAALLELGYDLNTTDEAEIRAAWQLLSDAKQKGVYQAFVMDEVYGKMEGGNAAIAMYYAGDYLTMLENNEDLRFVVPEEGSNWFVDAMCVLKTAQHKEEAMEWINFIASTQSNLANMDYIYYASPNTDALAEYPDYYFDLYDEELDRELYEIMVTPPEVLERCALYENLPADTLRLYNQLWTQLGI